MITKPSKTEKVQAIRDAVKPVAEYLKSIGKIEAFANITEDEICGLIRVAQEGVQESLCRQLGRAVDDNLDEIPL